MVKHGSIIRMANRQLGKMGKKEAPQGEGGAGNGKLLVFLPEGRHGSQFGDDCRHFFEDKINLIFSVVDRQAEAKRTMCRGERYPHRPEDVGRLEGA